MKWKKPKGYISNRLKRDKWLYILILPGVLYFLTFKYLPMWGMVIAFQDFSPFLGVFESKWVGLEHFENFFGNPIFFQLLRNTLLISFYNLLFFFPMPIIMALLLNEVRNILFKKAIQTLVYIPHFISMVIVCSITYVFLTTEGGIINELLFAWTGKKIAFLTDIHTFRPLIVGQIIWKETGWGTIIFLAALAGVDPNLYEAAIIDGAGRWRQLWHITLPSIKSTIIIIFILRLGRILQTGFEQILLMANALNREVAEVFDTYVYLVGVKQGSFSYSTAVGIFKSVVGIVLIVTANNLAKKAGQTTLY